MFVCVSGCLCVFKFLSVVEEEEEEGEAQKERRRRRRTERYVIVFCVPLCPLNATHIVGQPMGQITSKCGCECVEWHDILVRVWP